MHMKTFLNTRASGLDRNYTEEYKLHLDMTQEKDMSLWCSAARDRKMETMVLPDGATHRGHHPSKLKGQRLAILRNIFTNFAYRSIF